MTKLRLCFMFYNRFKNGAAPILTQPHHVMFYTLINIYEGNLWAQVNYVC